MHFFPKASDPRSVLNKPPQSEDDAALAIQTQFRGYKARKEIEETKGYKYTGSGTDVYDAKTIRLLKKCCRRWRRRSLFQMLLLYRSVRQQDLVYFCQQVHMYNQGATDGMKQTEMQLVSQDHIKNVNRNEASFILGRQPVFVRKVPFQFHMLPFFDTSHFCDPVDAGLDSMYSDNRRGPRDYDTWDAPLRRNKLGRADSNKVFQRNKKQLRNQGCQTGAGHAADKLANVNQQNKITPHIQTPYRRELLDNQPKMPKKPRSPVPGPSTSAAASRPDEFSNDIPMKSVSAVRGKFESSNNYPARSGAKPAGHIQELKSIGKEMSGSDTGTFNFQGMLRKTNYNRGSMKRNDIYSPDDAPSSFKISSYNQDNSNMWEKNNVDQTSKGPSYSAVVKQKTKNVGFENDKNRHELAPGVIVEGDVADL